ncbi:MAG: hypothetical protein ACR2KZ_15160 [Segetibacter sp.]
MIPKEKVAKKPQHEYRHLGTPTEGLGSEQTLQEYIKNTDHIVGLLDGSIQSSSDVLRCNTDTFQRTGVIAFEDQPTYEQEIQPKPDAVLWLDKSARPVSWLVRELWDQLATKNEDGSVPEIPKSVFLNIDREPWLAASGVDLSDVDTTRSNQFDINNIANNNESVRQIIGKIRGLFVQDSRVVTRPDGASEKIILSPSNFDEEVWNMPLVTKADGSAYQHMMVVDEVKSSGATIKIAQQLITVALPELSVTTAHWQTDKSARGSSTKGGWVPVWYSSLDASGRGVGDLNPSWYNKSNRNWKHRLGATVLSAPQVDGLTGERVGDKKAQEIRREIKQLVSDLGHQAILFTPSSKRSVKDRVARIEDINKLSFSKWQDKKGIKRRP